MYGSLCCTGSGGSGAGISSADSLGAGDPGAGARGSCDSGMGDPGAGGQGAGSRGPGGTAASGGGVAAVEEVASTNKITGVGEGCRMCKRWVQMWMTSMEVMKSAVRKDTACGGGGRGGGLALSFRSFPGPFGS